MCDLCNDPIQKTTHTGSWNVCQACMRNGTLARAAGLEFRIAKLQNAVVELSSSDRQEVRGHAAQASLQRVYEAYASLTTAMSDLAISAAGPRPV